MPVFSAYVRDVAAGLDFDVRVARHAEDFRALHRDFLPDVVSLDMMMSQGDGFQLLNWLGDQDSRACVLILSGYGTSFIAGAKRLAQTKGPPSGRGTAQADRRRRAAVGPDVPGCLVRVAADLRP